MHYGYLLVVCQMLLHCLIIFYTRYEAIVKPVSMVTNGNENTLYYYEEKYNVQTGLGFHPASNKMCTWASFLGEHEA
jgi:hypothetical protein